MNIIMISNIERNTFLTSIIFPVILLYRFNITHQERDNFTYVNKIIYFRELLITKLKRKIGKPGKKKKKGGLYLYYQMGN